MRFIAVAQGDIPRNRLLVLEGPVEGQANKVIIRLANAGETADFVSRQDITDGQEVVVSIKGNPVWSAEAGSDISAGDLLAVATDGKVVADVEGGAGYSIQAAAEGEIAQFVRASSSTPGPQGPKGDPGPQGPKGDPGEVTQAQFDALEARVAALEDGGS